MDGGSVVVDDHDLFIVRLKGHAGPAAVQSDHDVTGVGDPPSESDHEVAGCLIA